jgi:nucleoside-diphosphate-sugar epimerase
VRTLLERQCYTVFCLCRPAAALPVVPASLQGRLVRVEGDVESEESLIAAIEHANPELVFHLAGVYAWWQADSSRYARVNEGGVRHLLAACQRADHVRKVVHVSTVLAYGSPPGGLGLSPASAFDEDSPAGPAASEYARSKHVGDCIAQAAFESGEVDGCTCFLACCIGADPRLLDPQRDVMKIRPLVHGLIPATISSETTFTYRATTALSRLPRAPPPPPSKAAMQPPMDGAHSPLAGTSTCATRPKRSCAQPRRPATSEAAATW